MADKQIKRVAFKLSDGTGIAVLDPVVLANSAINDKVPDATSTNAGKTKLSDDINSTLDALNGKTASTPKAIKTVNDKVGDTTQLKTKNKTNLVEAVNSLHTTLFPSGSEESSEGITNVAYVNKANTFDKSQTLTAGIAITGGKATAPTPDFKTGQDDEIVTLKVVRDVRENKYPIYVQIPTLNVEGAPSSVKEDPTLTGSPFVVVGGNDTHEATDWIIEEKSSKSEVWSSKNDTSHLTSIKVDKKKLKVSTDYVAKVRYKGKGQGWTAYAEKEFRTKSIFVYVQTPTISINGGTSNVTPNSVITGSTFTLVE